MKPVLVAGGGLAGAAAAAVLARAGQAVTLVERNAGPTDKICGEFLSAEAAAALSGLGLDVGALGGARITHVRLVRGAKMVTTKLPFAGLGLSRRVLDEALLRHAAACGVDVRRGHAVRGVEAGDEGVALDVDGGGTLRGGRLLLATGKHELRGWRRAEGAENGLVGFKMYFALAPAARAALAGHVELIMFRDGYAGLQLVEGERANFCLLVNKTRLAECGGWDGLLAWLCESSPHLAARLAGAVALLPAPLSIARVPYGFVHRAAGPARVYRLGDQAGVIQSFTGDGMAIALHSAMLAAGAVRRGETAAAYHRQLARDVTGQIRRAGALYRVAQTPAAQPALLGLARLWPAGLALAARLTRVPERVRVA
jgi:flavin-dependent dehydrogenase